jgi:hypothetical protein
MTTATMTAPARSARPARVPGGGSSGESPATGRLILAARLALVEAQTAGEAGERYAAAHLAALRAAAAVLAERARPTTRSRRPTSAWSLLTDNAPDLAEWAAYFAAGANKRVAAQSGLRGAVTTREADDLLRQAGQFIALVESRLGMLPLLVRDSRLS